MSFQKGSGAALPVLLFAPFSVLSRDVLPVETINGVNESIKALCYTPPLAAALMHGSVHLRRCRDTDGASPSPWGRRHRQLLTPSDRFNQSKYRAVLCSAKPQRSAALAVPPSTLRLFLCSRPLAFPGRFDAPPRPRGALPCVAAGWRCAQPRRANQTSEGSLLLALFINSCCPPGL